MRKSLLVAGVVGWVGLAAACSGDKTHAGVAPDGGGSSSRGGTRTSGGSSGTAGHTDGGMSDGGMGDGGSPDPAPGKDGPKVQITNPTALDDPNEAGVLSGDTVTVDCVVTQVGVTKVNAASVTLALLDAAGEVVDEKLGTPTGATDTYANTFNLADVEAGVVSFRCSAEDVTKNSSSTKISTFLDKGPLITFVSPSADSFHPVTQPLDVEFTVEAAPLSATDDGAEVKEVALSIAGQAVDLKGTNDKPGHYRLQVNPQTFSPVLNGATPITVQATNSRKPAGTKATATESVGIDGAAPTIKIVLNQPDPIVVGNTVVLTFTVTDDVAGVDPSTVVVSLNNMAPIRYDAKSDAWTRSKDTFTYSFDSRQVDLARVQITVTIGAKDQVGNAAPNVSQLLYVDNYPPALDLDPLNIRTIADTAGAKCSVSFDPVGNRAANDYTPSAATGTFRALVSDQTNSIDGVRPVGAGTDSTSVRLYMQPEAGKALLVDNDEDGKCDDVLDPQSPVVLTLKPIDKQGGALFGHDDDEQPTSASLSCTTDAPPSTPPTRLCDAHDSDMWQVVWDRINKAPVIFVNSPSSLDCTGAGWDFNSKLKRDGWVCFAVRAVDNVGNVGVSRPLRLCVDDPANPGTPSCAMSSETPPTCTDGCTPAPRLGGELWTQ